jgi:hypothetical protein
MEVADESDMKVWTDVGVLHDEGERVAWRGDGGEQNLRRVLAYAVHRFSWGSDL